MKSRAAVSIALAAALGVSLSACNFFAPQRTTANYAASDGAHIDAGAYQLRNLIVIAPPAENGKGSEMAVLTGALVNNARTAGTVTIAYDGGKATIQVPAHETLIQLSFGDGEQVELTGADFIPGQELEVTVTPSGQGDSATVAIPVLDGTLAEYSTLVPSGSAEPTARPTILDSTVAPTDGPVSTANEDAGSGSGTGTAGN